MSVVIRAKNGKLILDIHYGNGKRTRPSTGLDDTSEHRKLLEDNVIPQIKCEIAQGTYFPKAQKKTADLTVKQYSEKSYSRHASERREHVDKKFRADFNNHIIPVFGDRLIQSITAMELLDWQIEKLKKYKAGSVKKYRSALSVMFDDAVLEGIIDFNPFEKVKYPVDVDHYDPNSDGFDGEDSQVDPFSLDEIYALLEKTDGYKFNFIGIMAFSGARPGELIGLKWDDVDFKNELFKIKRTMIRGKLGYPKTRSSIRTIPMAPGVKEYFQSQYLLTNGYSSNMVFLNSSNKPFYSHDVIAKQFKSLLDANDRRYLYQLRHSFGSLMISNGESIPEISRIMGHKTPDITMKIYVKAYKVIEDKKSRIQIASFLNERHKSGTKKEVVA